MADERLSLKEQLTAAYEEVVPEGSDEDLGTEIVDPGPPSQYTRDEQGRFVKKADEDKGDEGKEEAAASEGGEPKPEEQAAPDESVDKETIPGFLTDEGKALWAQLPEEYKGLKDLIQKYESEQSAGAQSVAEELNKIKPEYEALSQVLEPYMPVIQQSGQTPAQLISKVLRLAAQAEQDFPAFVREQSRIRGTDLAQLVENINAEATQDIPDPGASALYQQLQWLAQEVGGLKNNFATYQNELGEAEWNKFTSATDGEGNLLRPHVERVRQRMALDMQANPSLSPEDAYTNAVWADPELRETLIADQNAAKEAERKAELERQANAAKSNGGDGASSYVPPPPGSSIRAQLSAAWDKSLGDQRVN